MKFKLSSPYQPAGDQPEAIKDLTNWVREGHQYQTLLGVTGSGKTYSIANVIQQTQLPTLIISHNKTLAAQLYQEFRDFFPDNAVSYFVSYYDYYQPEAYIPQTDTYIEKETSINDEIDKLRLSTTTNLLTRPDCVVIASVSCLYNLGSPVEYGKFTLELTEGQLVDRQDILSRLIELQYERSTGEITRGKFRSTGETIEVYPAYQDLVLRLVFNQRKLESITWLDPLNFTSTGTEEPSRIIIFPAKHYITDPVSQKDAFKQIEHDLKQQVKRLQNEGKKLEAYRLEQKVNYDLEMINEFGFVAGIENYSRYFDGRLPGEPPFTLLDYMDENAKRFNQPNFLTIIDESHITLPQIRGMHRGDQSRKQTLIEYGFRLPAALDNRPLTYSEFAARTPQLVYTSAKNWEFEKAARLRDTIAKLK